MSLITFHNYEKKTDTYSGEFLPSPVNIRYRKPSSDSKEDRVVNEIKKNSLQIPEKVERPKKNSFKNLFQRDTLKSNRKEKFYNFQELDDLVDKVTRIPGHGSYADLKAIKEAKKILKFSSKHLKVKSSIESKILQDNLKTLHHSLNAAKSLVCENPDVINDFIKERMTAFREGIKVRNLNVTIRQMSEILEGRLLGVKPKELMDVCRMLCREINTAMENPNKVAGKYILLQAEQEKYPFYFHDKRKKKELILDFTYWLKVSENAEFVELFIVPNTKNPLGSGTYKTIRKAQYLNIFFKREKIRNKITGAFVHVRPAIYKAMVLIKPKDYSSVDVIEAGITLQSNLVKHLSNSHLTSIPIKLPLHSEEDLNPKSIMFYFQDWYNTDLHQVANHRKVPLDFSEKPKTLKLKDSDILKIFKDIAETLIEWHEYGIIHRDIKPSNILIQVLDDGKTVNGILADYDIAQPPGKGFISDDLTPYEFWDTLSNQSVVTPFTDFYGISMSLANVFIPNLLSVERDHIMQNKHVFIAEAQKKSKLRGVIVRKILDYLKTVLEDDKEIIETFPLQKRLDKIKDQIDKYFCPYNDPSINDPDLDVIVASIPNFKTLKSFQQSTMLRSELIKALENEYITNRERLKLEEILVRTKQRINQKIMSDYLFKFPENKREKHPLYIAMQNPEKIVKETVQNEINEEIDLLDLSKNPALSERVSKAMEKHVGLETASARRRALKNELIMIIENPVEKEELKEAATKFLSKIYIIEDAMAYYVKLGEIYNCEAMEIVKRSEKGMKNNMQKFIKFLGVLELELST